MEAEEIVETAEEADVDEVAVDVVKPSTDTTISMLFMKRACAVCQEMRLCMPQTLSSA